VEVFIRISVCGYFLIVGLRNKVIIMIKLRLHKVILCFFTFLFCISLIGSIDGLVLCLGTNGHIHTEFTFNGVDCGHFKGTNSGETASDYLTKFNQTPHETHCISCVDIPLSFDYSLKKFDQANTQGTASKTRNIFSLLLPVPMNSLITATKPLFIYYPEHMAPTLNLIHNTILLL
jgi:hypothetical protein